MAANVLTDQLMMLPFDIQIIYEDKSIQQVFLRNIISPSCMQKPRAYQPAVVSWKVKLTTNLHTPAVKRSSSCSRHCSPHKLHGSSPHLGITNSHTIHTTKRRKANWTDRILRGKCRLKHVIEGKRRKDRSDAEDEERDVSSYWMTLMKRKDTAT